MLCDCCTAELLAMHGGESCVGATTLLLSFADQLLKCMGVESQTPKSSCGLVFAAALASHTLRTHCTLPMPPLPWVPDMQAEEERRMSDEQQTTSPSSSSLQPLNPLPITSVSGCLCLKLMHPPCRLLCPQVTLRCQMRRRRRARSAQSQETQTLRHHLESQQSRSQGSQAASQRSSQTSPTSQNRRSPQPKVAAAPALV